MALALLAASSCCFAVAIGGAFDDVALARPWALWAFAIALPVFVAHLYRRRRRRIAVAFVPLVREAIGPVHARGAWRRAREALRLLCRVGAVAALVLAIAGPKPVEAAVTIEDLVIVLDADETTSCVEPEGGPLVGTTRFRKQVSLAKAHALAHGAGRVGVVLAGPTPRTVVAPSDDRPAVRARLDCPDVRPGEGHGDLAAAITVARQAKASDRALRVLVLSSRDLSTLEGESDVLIEGAGAQENDQGIVDADAVPDATGHGFDVRVVVRNSARGDVICKLDAVLSAEDMPHSNFDVTTTTVEVPGGSEREVRKHVLAQAQTPRFSWRLVGSSHEPRQDAWDRNDEFVAVLVPRARPSVLVVHGGSPRPFVRALLDALGDTIDREASGLVSLSALPGTRPRDVTIVDGVGLPRGAITRGAWILVAPFGDPSASGGLPFRIGRIVREPIVWRVKTADPLLRGVDLTTAYVATASTILGEGARTLASVEGEAVVADGTLGAARWLAFGLDPDGSDLPVRAALPLLLANAIRQMGEMPKSPLKAFYRVGEPIAPRVELGPTSVSWFDPGADGALSRSPPAAGCAPVDAKPALAQPARLDRWGPDAPLPFAAPARVLWASSGAGERRAIAVNRLDRSFDIRPARPPSPPPPPAPPPPEDPASRWLRWLLIAAGALLVTDLVLGAVGKRFVALPSTTA